MAKDALFLKENYLPSGVTPPPPSSQCSYGTRGSFTTKFFYLLEYSDFTLTGSQVTGTKRYLKDYKRMPRAKERKVSKATKRMAEVTPIKEEAEKKEKSSKKEKRRKKSEENEENKVN